MRIGYMVEGHFLYPGMRVRDCAKFQRAGYSRWDDAQFDQIINHFGIAQSTHVAHLSRGQRAGVSLALVNSKELRSMRYFEKALNIAFHQIRLKQ